MKDRAGGVEILVELRELVAFAGEHPRRGRLARLERPRLDAGEVTAQVAEIAHLPKLTIADAIDAAIQLLAYDLIDPCIDDGRLDLFTAEQAQPQALASRPQPQAGRHGWAASVSNALSI